MSGTKKHSLVPRPYNDDCATCHVCCPAQCWRDVQTQPPPLMVRMVQQKLGSLHPWLHAQRPVAVSVLQQRSGTKTLDNLGKIWGHGQLWIQAGRMPRDQHHQYLIWLRLHQAAGRTWQISWKKHSRYSMLKSFTAVGKFPAALFHDVISKNAVEILQIPWFTVSLNHPHCTTSKKLRQRRINIEMRHFLPSVLFSESSSSSKAFSAANKSSFAFSAGCAAFLSGCLGRCSRHMLPFMKRMQLQFWSTNEICWTTNSLKINEHHTMLCRFWVFASNPWWMWNAPLL